MLTQDVSFLSYRCDDINITRRVLHLLHSVFHSWNPGEKESTEIAELYSTLSRIIDQADQYDSSVVAIVRRVIVDGKTAQIYMYVSSIITN